MAGLQQQDELHRPLGATAPKAPRAVPFGRLALLAGVALLAGFVVFIMKTGDHFGGEPYAIASVDMHPPAPPPPTIVAAAAPAAPAGPTSASQIETSSGVKVVRGGGGG